MALDVQITFDCADADRLAAFWAIALDYELEPPPDGFATWPEFLEARGIPVPPPGTMSAVVDPERKRPRVLFRTCARGQDREEPDAPRHPDRRPARGEGRGAGRRGRVRGAARGRSRPAVGRDDRSRGQRVLRDLTPLRDRQHAESSVDPGYGTGRSG